MFYPDNGSLFFPINVYLAAEKANPYFTGPTDEKSIVCTVRLSLFLLMTSFLHDYVY